ncbi:MAG: SpoIID/LytB domain-containing protein [Pseudomonadota bacterium]
MQMRKNNQPRSAAQTAGRTLKRLALVLVPALLAFSLQTCTSIEEEPAVGVRVFPLDAFCSVNVRGIGWVDAETDYIPHVIQCENGGADMEALKVQAVSARSFMYYKMETAGSIGDGTGDQVYSCGRTPTAEHHAAVEATSGQVLTYSGVTVCAFYVAGADPSNRSTCMATGSDPDPTNTERYVTYNEGLSGSGIEQSTLGWVHPENYRNRGCMSQWGSRCLDERGDNYRDILRFYYGEDIGIETAVGECIGDPCVPGTEVCNGADDDCDDEVDEDYAPYTCGNGECLAESTCTGGVEDCSPLPAPSGDDATCDGRDENCSGSVDEDYEPTTCGKGGCARESSCSDGEETCTPGEPAADDSECNGVDDDCDGLTDEDCDDPPPADATEDAEDVVDDLPADAPADTPRPDDGTDGGGIHETGLTSGCSCAIVDSR